MLLDPASPLRRHYEQLAKNLLALEERVGTVVVTSPEPGAGCSSVCLGLGAALAGIGRRTAVVDCNLEKPNLHRMLGEPNFVGLTSGLQSGKPLEGYGHEVVPGLLVLATGPVPSDPAARLETGRFVRAVRELGSDREIVILDAPVAGKVLESPAFSSGFDGVLLVIHASRTSKSTARDVTDDLLDAGINLLGVVLNGAGERA
jgi:non-specific protein-tyrosine kinase